ncbi:hypothetical protein CS006_06645 [Bifidobacterium primatium]|uniref:DUF2975 domain-containing protein n=1 Tax=Bifidobacterium primatium TaxID=2045438 RepID=A0A2M9H7Z0_9BIFI|nr:DUF2975 domain-containing protein [Bifidobacterium primatium]PJM72933.1 hypothetical protein CS006_06645 [Bifidobacterium primatium]
MSKYMNTWVLGGLKAIVVLIWLACLWGQVFAVPTLSAALAGLYPGQAAMRWPYLVLGVLFLLCVEMAFVGVWRLFSLSGSGVVFTAKARPCVNLIIGGASVGTMLTAVVLVCFVATGSADAAMPAMDFFSIVAVLGATLVAEIGFILLMVVMNGLLRAATDQSDELEQVI